MSSAPPPPTQPLPVINMSSMFRALRVPARMWVPIAGGAPSDTIDESIIGRAVRRGEPLVDRWPEGAAAPLAPADGRIAGIGTARLSAGQTAPAILVDADDAASAPPREPTRVAALHEMLRRLRGTDLPAGIERLRRLGVWADRWTSPDLLGQLHGCLRKPADTVICNVMEEDATITLQGRVATAYAVDVVAGTLALALLNNADRVWAVLPAFGPIDCWEAMRSAALGTKLKLVPLRNDYPQAHPTLLIHELTGRHARPARLPSEAGALVLDAPAAAAVGRAFLADEPMLTTPIGVRDPCRDSVHFVWVPVGMRLHDVLAQLDLARDAADWRGGNPLRQWRLTDDAIVAGAELTLTAATAEGAANPDPCVRCAWCVEGCPVRIQPAGLLEAAQLDDPYLADQYGLDACIECGICSYVCPSNLPLLTGIRVLRGNRARGR